MSASAKSKNAFANVIVGLLVVMAITLATASTIHLGVAVAGVDDSFSRCRLARGDHLRCGTCGRRSSGSARFARLALGVGRHTLGIFGFLVGLRFTLFGGRSVVFGDVVYHLAGLLVLVVIAGLLLSSRGHAALGKA